MRKLLGGMAVWTIPVIAMALISGCTKDSPNRPAPQAEENGQVEALAKLCGFECKVLADGDAHISGVKKLDAFFDACLSIEAQASTLEAEIKAELGSIAAAMGADVAADASLDDLSGAIDAQMSGEFGANFDGGLTLDVQPPKCEITASASIEAAAKCDANVDPGSATVECSGNCEAEASAMAECSGDATLKCKGTAPSFSCDGTCTGSCELEAGAKCEGECKGTCEVDGSVECNGTCQMDGTAACDGDCKGDTDSGGNCTGECELNAGAKCTGECKLNAGATCEGSCNGSCELTAGGSCQGSCKGECEYTPPDGKCEASATAKCEAKADAKVECSGKCDGEVVPPMVDADCEASAKADAQLNAECYPPAVALKYNLSADAQAMFAADADAQASFEGRMNLIANAWANVAAKGAKVEGIVNAVPALAASGEGAAKAVLDTVTKAQDLRLMFQVGCGVSEVGSAVDILDNARASLQGTASAVASVGGSLGAL